MNYPDGVTTYDIDYHFGDAANREAYRRYCDDCKADKIWPMSYETWLDEQECEPSSNA